MSWPALRTVPATSGPLDGSAILGGSFFAGVLAPASAWAVLAVVDSVAGPCPALSGACDLPLWRLIGLIAVSPYLSWLVLLGSAPVVWAALRLGWAGWLVAVTFGLLAGPITLGLIDFGFGNWELQREDILVSGVGAILGLAYWFGLRLAAPHLFRP